MACFGERVICDRTTHQYQRWVGFHVIVAADTMNPVVKNRWRMF